MTARAITKSLTLGVPNSGCPIFLSPAPASIAITVHRNITISDDGTPVTVASEKTIQSEKSKNFLKNYYQHCQRMEKEESKTSK